VKGVKRDQKFKTPNEAKLNQIKGQKTQKKKSKIALSK
jgi:hypothetical protein